MEIVIALIVLAIIAAAALLWMRSRNAHARSRRSRWRPARPAPDAGRRAP